MNRKLVQIVISVIVLGGVGGGAYIIGSKHNNPASSNNQTQSTKPSPTNTAVQSAPTPQPTTVKQAQIQSLDPAGLLNASFRRRLADFTAWTDSGVTPTYTDFNGDGITDAFVWAKIPGTLGSSFAAVWTLDTKNQPQELWFVPTAQRLNHSTWSISGVKLTEKGDIETPGGTDSITNVYHWNGTDFVTE